MGTKRTADDLEPSVPRTRREAPKRAKLSSSAENDKDSSEPSSCSVSEDSALQSSPQPSPRDRVSSMSSLEITDAGSDSESSISSDSDSDVSESEGEEIPTVGGPKKPNIRRIGAENGNGDLKARIAAFLPQMKEANGLLTSEGGMRSIEDVEDGEQHIEMNLGLGVLEEQKDEDDSEGSGSSEDSEREDGGNEEPDVPVSSAARGPSPSRKETRVMDKLKGHRTGGRNAGIEEVG